MATPEQVKKYLAYWFQVGKPVICPKGDRRILPQEVVIGDRYTQEFEQYWQELLQPQNRDCYLVGTDQTIAALLSSRWTIDACSRCAMPIPVDELGITVGCPCFDLESWPNNEIPLPRAPVDVRNHLSLIRERLRSCLNHLD